MKAYLSLLVLAFGSANAAIPEKGIWWNPSESGRGYGIDVQDDLLFVTYYGFDESGKSTFFTSLGILDSTNSTWVDADWVGFSGGQCWGCTYSRPVANTKGSARFKFDTPLTGTITLSNGGTIPIERQSAAGFNPAKALLGTWQMTHGSLGVYFGDILWLNRARDESKGEFAGVRVGGGASRVLVGGPAENKMFTASILLDSSASYYTFYHFTWGLDQLAGRSWTFLKTSNLSGSGLPLFGSKLYGEKISQGILKSVRDIEKSESPDDPNDEIMAKIAFLSSADDSPSVKIGDQAIEITEIQKISSDLIHQASTQ